MLDLTFDIAGVEVLPNAAVPTLSFQLRITEAAGAAIHAILLRAQVQIQPRSRKYLPAEQERLSEVFGAPERWRDTLRPLLWTQASAIAPAFSGTVEMKLPIACTYDLEVIAGKYLRSLENGEVSLLFLFSGTVFAKTETGFRVEQIPWEKEAGFRLPVQTWRDLMDTYFPAAGWLRLRHETLDALQRFKAQRAHFTWEDAIEELLAAQQEAVR
jgi:hypothetical protein